MQQVKSRHVTGKTFVILAAVALVVSAVSVSMVAASPLTHHSATSGPKLSAKSIAGHQVIGQTLNVFNLPKETASQASAHRSMPLLSGSKLIPAKAAAAHNTHAPKASGLAQTSDSKSSVIGFQGMQDSATICPYFGGCQPPDMALASGPSFVLQAVNTSIEIYNTKGVPVVGPVNSQVFFGIPNPTPAGCDPAGPFTSDPRAFYDMNTGLFWVAFLQVEGAPGFGIAPNCDFVTKYWIANLSMKTGIEHVYSFDMSLGTTNAADYTQFGFNKDVIAFSGNMFDSIAGTYSYAESGFANKAAMQNGLPVTANFVADYTVGGVVLDTVQPVETITTPVLDPGVEYLVSSFNIFGDPFGDDCFFTACHGFSIWAYNPATNTISGVFADSNPYVTPPNADQPGCSQCVETIDTRITGTPVYSVGSGNGLISFSLDTAIQNGAASTVPGIFWGQLQPALTGGSVFAAGIYQSSYLAFAGDQAASFGAMMQDKNGRLVMVFDTMSASLNPSIMYTGRAKGDPLGSLRSPHFLIKGTVTTFDSRWGDFEAASYDGFSTNHIWVASQYSIGDWATFIARV
jgi:hypothetical protein